jgi:glycine C-acetyltransferase
LNKYPNPRSKSEIKMESSISPGYDNMKVVCRKQITALEKIKGADSKERIISSAQGAKIIANGERMINFCANNYLGLSNHPSLIEAAKEKMDSHGYGLSSVRFICGTQDIHKDLESSISRFHKTDSSILFSSCFDANAAVFEALLTDEDAVISDSLNHASIIDGIRLCKAERHRFRHMDMSHLEEVLKATMHKRLRLIVSDGVFSMDGDICPLSQIVELAYKYKACTMTDEAHCTGVIGATGRGTAELFGLMGKVDIITSTLGKGMGGGTGGYIAGRQDVIDLLRLKGRPYLFSNSIPPAIVGASLKVFEMMDTEEGKGLVRKLAQNVKRFRGNLAKVFFTLS